MSSGQGQGHSSKKSVFVCPVRSLNFACFDLNSLFLVCTVISLEYLGRVPISRSAAPGHHHRKQEACLGILSVGGLPLIERPSVCL